MSSSKQKETPKLDKRNSTPFPVVDNFQSPINLWSLAIPPDIDRELVRSVAFFGDSDCFREVTNRLPSFQFLDPATKRSVRERRRYLLSTKKLHQSRFEELCLHYNIPIDVSRDLNSEFTEELEENLFEPRQRQTTRTEKMAMTMYKYKGKYYIYQ